jgi:hypothetical protein
MSTNPAPIEVTITAQIQGLTNGLKQATSGVQNAASQMAGSFTAVTSSAAEAGVAAQQAGSQIAAGMQKADFSMREAKASMALMGEEIGVRIPRHIRGFVAELPGVGAAMNVAFSGFAIIGIIEVLVEAGKKVYEFSKSLSELSKEEQKHYDETLKNAKDELDFRTKILRAEYELQIAKATGIEKDRLRVEEASALVKLNKDYVGELQKEKAHLQELATAQQTAADAALKMQKSATEMPLSGGGAALGAGIMAYFDAGKAEAAKAKVGELQRTIQEADAAVTTAEAHEVEARNALHRGEAKVQDDAAKARNEMLAAFVQESIADLRTKAEEEKRIDDEVEAYGERLLKQQLDEQERAYKQEEEAQRLAAEEYRKKQQLEAEEERGFEADAGRKIQLARSGSLERIRLAQDEANRVKAIFGQESEQYLKAQDRVTQAMQSWKSGFGAIGRGFSATLQGMMQGTQSFNQGMANMFRNIALSFAQSLETMLAQWVEHLILKSILKNAYEESDAKKGAFRDAKDAARGGFKAGMHLPFPLNVVMAPILAGIGFAGVMASASGGWERVPSDQLAMIHKDEQVLPAGYAEGLRNLVAGGGGGDTHVHLHGTMIDRAFWQKHQGAIVSTIHDAVGNRRLA